MIYILLHVFLGKIWSKIVMVWLRAVATVVFDEGWAKKETFVGVGNGLFGWREGKR